MQAPVCDEPRRYQCPACDRVLVVTPPQSDIPSALPVDSPWATKARPLARRVSWTYILCIALVMVGVSLAWFAILRPGQQGGRKCRQSVPVARRQIGGDPTLNTVAVRT